MKYFTKDKGMDLENKNIWHHLTGPVYKQSKGLNHASDSN